MPISQETLSGAGLCSADSSTSDSRARGPRLDTWSGHVLLFLLLLIQESRKYVHEVLVNRLGGPSLPRKSVVRLTDRPDMTIAVYHGCKTTTILSASYLLVVSESCCPTLRVKTLNRLAELRIAVIIVGRCEYF